MPEELDGKMFVGVITIDMINSLINCTALSVALIFSPVKLAPLGDSCKRLKDLSVTQRYKIN